MVEETNKCSGCNKEFPTWQLSSRDNECKDCLAESRSGEMTVGDLGSK